MKKLLIAMGLAIIFSAGNTPFAAKRAPSTTAQSDGRHAVLGEAPPPFEIDVGSLRGKIDQLRIDEHREQIADWAVYGTLYQVGLPAEVIRTAMYDKVPFRLPLLEGAARWDYGPGRRVLLPGGQVWLFHSEYDPNPDVTIARLADRVRMEIGHPPDRVRVFAFESDLVTGTIRVRHTRDIGGDELFSPTFGYYAARVSTAPQLAEWLNAVDDLTHVRLLQDGAVELAGRRFGQFRTMPAGLSSVSTLYHAQAVIDENHAAVEAYMKKVVDAFNEVVDSYNAATHRGPWILPTASASSYAEVERLLNVGGAANLFGASASPTYGRLLVGATKDEIKALRTRVDLFELALATGEASIPGIGKRLPEAPGFSLDPTWEVTGLRADLATLLSRPDVLLKQARDRAKPVAADTIVGSPSLDAAIRVNKSAPGGKPATLPSNWRERVEKVRSELPRTGSKLSDAVLLDLERLSEDTRTDDEVAPALIYFALASHRIQCARYDGPLQGTDVAMNLFYTDVLAKTLAGLDFHKKAPIDEVLGFATVPNTAPEVEAAFWEEDLSRPSTRLWFGPKADGMAISVAEDEINFDHIASRVYSAGSNPLSPGREQAANEGTGRVLRWWDHHFDQIADYEQQYHLQNQIMKWSVVTGWLESKRRLHFLATSSNDQKNEQFDQWYGRRTDLRFREPLDFRSRSEWPGGAECIDILQSRPILADGRFEVISGGVSLASEQTLKAAARVNEAIPVAFRRAGLTGEFHAGSPRLRSTDGTTFDLPAHKPISSITLAADQRLRGGGVEVNARRLDTTVASTAGTGSVAVDVGGRPLGRLNVERTTRGVRLGWSDGLMMRASAEASELAHSGRPGALGGARAAALQPRPGSYAIRKGHGSVQAVISPSEGTKEPAVLLKVGVGADAGGKPLLRTAEGDWIAALLGGKPDIETAVAVEVSKQSGSQMVDALPWQTLRLSGGGDPSASPALSRVFTDVLPGPVSRRARLHTGDSRIPVVEASFIDGGVALRRPAGAHARAAFNDLFTNLDLSPGALQEMISTAHAGQNDIFIGKAGSLGKEHSVPTAAIVNPDVSIREAYAKALKGDLDLAVSLATGGVKGPRGPPASGVSPSDQIAGAIGARAGGDARVLADYLQVRARVAGGTPMLALERRGHALQTVATVSAQPRPVPAAEVARSIRAGDVTIVYAQDSRALGHLDWDAAPGDTGAKVAANPALHWDKIDLPPALAGIEPTQLAIGQEHYVRRSVTNHEAHTSLDEGTTTKSHARFVYVVSQSCDTNGDGVVDAAEQANCP